MQQSSSKRVVRVARGDPQMSRQLVQEFESGDVVPVFRSRTQVSSKDTEDVFRTGENRGGVRTVHTTRVVKHVTTSSTGENKMVTETLVSSSGNGHHTGANSASAIEFHQTSPDVRTVTKTTTKVVKQGESGQKSGRVTTKKIPGGEAKVTEKTTRKIIRKTVVGEEPRKQKISDIITGLSDESVTAREALLRWAQRTTERYPGVRVVDFTNSWKDGLAFSAILHRNRPDLLDFRSLRTRSARDNLDNAFSVAEKEFGITRLLDPEDVDTPEPDEKSIITYISSVYDVFPDPPALHPLINDEKQQKVEEYKELTISLQMWMQESLATLRSRNYPNTVLEMKALLNERSQFRSEDIPKRLKDKHKLSHLHQEIQKLAKETGKVTFEGDLSLVSVEKRWNQVLAAHQENETSIREEISRLEKLQKAADKINREAKMCDVKLDDIEKRILEEEKRIQRLQATDAKHNCDQIEGQLKTIEDSIKSMKKDIKTLMEGNYYQTIDIDNRVHVIYERYVSLRFAFQNQLLLPLSTKPSKIEEKKVIKQRAAMNSEQKGFDSSKTFNLLKEHIEWVEKKHKRLNDLDSGTDLPSIKSSLEVYRNEHKSIENYRRKIDQCVSQKNSFTGEDFISFGEQLSQLEKSYSELLVLSSTKLQDTETLFDFVQSATKELKWMSEKEEIEVSRDWSAKNLNIVELEHYQEFLTSELEKREIQLNALQNRGENFLLQQHSSSKCIEDHVSLLQSQWSWLLQLTLCLEVHLKHVQAYHQFFKDSKECEQWLKKIEERLHNSFSRAIVSVDEGEKTLKQIHQLREELSRYSDIILSVIKQSFDIVNLKQRRQSVSKPVKVIAICNYKQSNVVISKDESYMLLNNSHKSKWKVAGMNEKETVVPGVCFVIPPVNAETVEIGEMLKKKYDAVLSSWSSKEQKLRQNLIIATIRVVKSWDISQFRSMETTQRESIIRALNEDTQKLLSEGSTDDSTLQKLKQEMEHCNQLFHSLVEKLSIDESQKSLKSSVKKILDEIASVQADLSDKEKLLKAKLHDPILWNLDSLENFVIEHKDFEVTLRSFEVKLKEIKQLYSTHPKKTACQNKYDTLVSTWDRLWELSNLYIERLKALEIALLAFTEATQVVSNFEVQLASFENMPSDMENLKNVYDKLMCLQTDVQQHQSTIDFVSESVRNVKNLVHRTRPKQVVHSDLKKLENDIKKLCSRWENVSLQIVERLRSCSAASELQRTYKNKANEDNLWISETTVKVNSLKTVKTMSTKEVEMQVEPVMNLYSSIAEHNSSFELTNILGARYIREAKIYDLRLKHYKESLEEEHPSLDASLLKRAKLVCGAEIITCELDYLNQTYERLMEKVLNYLEELKVSFSIHNKVKLCNIISKAVPSSLKTFRTVIDQAPALNLMDVDNCPLVVAEGKVYNTQIDEMCVLPDSIDQEICFQTMDLSSCIENKEMYDETNKTTENRKTVVNFHPHLLPNYMTQDNICQVKGIFNHKTLEMVTLQMAIEQGIVNLHNEEFTNLGTGKSISISDAVNNGYIDAAFFGRLSSKCGIFYPGTKEELTLLEAIQKHLYDPKEGTLLNPLEKTKITLTDAFHIGIIKKTGTNTLIQMGFIKATNLTISEAVEREFLDPNTGIFRDPLTNLTMNFPEAVNQGFLSISTNDDFETGITLTEALERNCVHDDLGQIIDEDSGEKMTITKAISKGLLRSNVKEIVNSETAEVYTIEDAVLQGFLNADIGRYIDKKMNLQLRLQEARARQLIFCPLTLKDAVEKNVVDDHGFVINPFKEEKLSIIGAISKGILDADSKCIVHPQSHELLSLPEAMNQGILSPSGKFYNSENNQEISIHQANELGYVTSVFCKSIFDIECVKDMEAGELICIKEAINKKIIDLQKDEFIDTSAKRTMSLKEAVSEQCIQHEIYNMFNKSVGVKSETGTELSLLECVKEDLFDCNTGYFKDRETKKPLFLNEAVEKKMITTEGAAILKGLLNISVTTATITKYVRDNERKLGDDSVNEKLAEGCVDLDGFSTLKEIQQSYSKSKHSVKCEQENFVPTKVINSSMALSKTHTGDESTNKISEIDQSQLNVKIKPDTFVKRENFTEQLCALQINNKIVTSKVDFETEQKSMIYSGSSEDVEKVENIHQTSINLPSDIHQTEQISDIGLTTNTLPQNLQGKFCHEKESNVQDFHSDNAVALSVMKPTKTDFHEQSVSHVHVLELPQDGWYLKEAIMQQLFDAESGFFTVPGTDKLVSFEETVNMEIINSNSAQILDPESNSLISMLQALDKGILSSIGRYTNLKTNARCTMKDAIEKKAILLTDRVTFEKPRNVKSTVTLQFTNTEIQSVFSEVSHVPEYKIFKTETQPKMQIHEVLPQNENFTNVSQDNIFEISPGIYFDPENLLIMKTPFGERVELLHCLQTETSISSLFQVKDLGSGEFIKFQDALQSRLVDHDTGDYCSPQLKDRIPFRKAIHIGYIIAPNCSVIHSSKKIHEVVNINNNSNTSGVPEHLNENIDSISISKNTYSEDIAGINTIETTETFHHEKVSDILPLKRSSELNVKKISTLPNEVTLNLASADRTEIVLENEQRLNIEQPLNILLGDPETSLPTQKQVIMLHKITKKMLPLNDGAKEGYIDTKTATAITNIMCQNNIGGLQTLREVLDKKLFDGNNGEILDFKTGEKLSINEAITHGYLDPENGKLLIPVGHSLTISEAYDQALVDPTSQCFIHPENGVLLSLNHAILCDIIDPLSLVVNPKTQHLMTLEDSISSGTINATENVIKGPSRNLSLVEGIKTNIFKPSKLVKSIPPLALTFPVAFQNNLINLPERQFIHPMTEKKYPIHKAIDNHMIMVIPKKTLPNSVLLDEALDKGLLDSVQKTFKHPVTNEIYPIHEAVNEGILIIKPEKVLHPLLETSLKLSFMKQMSLSVNRSELLSDVCFDKDARKTVGIQGGNSETEFDNPIILQADQFSNIDQSADPNKQISLENTLFELYDSKTECLIDPNTKQNVTIEELIKKGEVDGKTTIYDVKNKTNLTLTDALEANIIDSRTGKYIDGTTGKCFAIKDAVKLGLLAVLAAPLACAAAPLACAAAVTSFNIASARSKSNRSSLPIAGPSDNKFNTTSGEQDVKINTFRENSAVTPFARSLNDETIESGVCYFDEKASNDDESSVLECLISSKSNANSSYNKTNNLPFINDDQSKSETNELHATNEILTNVHVARGNEFYVEKKEELYLSVEEKDNMHHESPDSISVLTVIQPVMDSVESIDPKVLPNAPCDASVISLNNTVDNNFPTLNNEQQMNIKQSTVKIESIQTNVFIPEPDVKINTPILSQGNSMYKCFPNQALQYTETDTDSEVKFVSSPDINVDFNSKFPNSLYDISSDHIQKSQKDLHPKNFQNQSKDEHNGKKMSPCAVVEKQLELHTDKANTKCHLPNKISKDEIESFSSPEKLHNSEYTSLTKTKAPDLPCRNSLSSLSIQSVDQTSEKTSHSHSKDNSSSIIFEASHSMNSKTVSHVTMGYTSHSKKCESSKAKYTDDSRISFEHSEQETLLGASDILPIEKSFDASDLDGSIPTIKKSAGYMDKNTLKPKESHGLMTSASLTSSVEKCTKLSDGERVEILEKRVSDYPSEIPRTNSKVHSHGKPKFPLSESQDRLCQPVTEPSLQRPPTLLPKSKQKLPSQKLKDTPLPKEIEFSNNEKTNWSHNSSPEPSFHKPNDLPNPESMTVSKLPDLNKGADDNYPVCGNKIIDKLSFKSEQTMPPFTSIDQTSTRSLNSAVVSSNKKYDIPNNEYVHSSYFEQTEPLLKENVKSTTNDEQLSFTDAFSSPQRKVVEKENVTNSHFSTVHEDMFPDSLDFDSKITSSTKISKKIVFSVEEKAISPDEKVLDRISKETAMLNSPIVSSALPDVLSDVCQYSVTSCTNTQVPVPVISTSCQGASLENEVSIHELDGQKMENTSVIPFSITTDFNSDIISQETCYKTTGQENISLQQALEKGLIKQESIIKFQSKNEVVLVDECNENIKHDPSAKLTASEIQENYKTCKENALNLLQWMAEIETRLSNLGFVKEDISSLRHQINSAKVLKDDLENQQHLVNTCLDQLRQLIQKGLEILSKEEVYELQKDLQSVKRRYDVLINECDRLLRRLVAALEELQKFKSEFGAFKQWLNQAEKEYNEKEKHLGNLTKLKESCEIYRTFASDVISHQADLRFIAMAAQKFLDESKDYIKTLSMFRVNLSKDLPNLEPLESEVKTQVQEISALFHNLLNSVNKLSDHYTIVHNKHRYFIESYDKAHTWFLDVKNSAKKALEQAVSAEPLAVQEQLDYIKTLNMEVVGQGRLIDNSLQSSKALIDCLNNFHVHSNEAQNVQLLVNNLKKDYDLLVDRITLKIKELQTALIHSQDIQDGLDRLLRWLDETESILRNQSKPVSLIVEKLDEQVQEFKILQSDVSNQKQSIVTIDVPSKELMNSNPKSAKNIESKWKDIVVRYDKVCEKINKREQLLEEISVSVRTFETMSNQFEEWTSSMLDRIESHDISQQLDVDGFASVIEYTMNQRNTKQDEYEEMVKTGKNLVMKRDVTDSSQIKDKIKNLEHMWKHLGTVLNEKQSLAKTRSEQLAAYEAMRSKVVEWVSKMETVLDNSEPISLDQVLLKKQLAEIKPILKEYSDYSSTIEKLNNLGHNYDLMIKGDSPRRKASSPVKKQSSPTRKSPSKTKSPESTPSSPIKNQLSTQSPLSTVSSGFSSRRSSTDNFSGIEDHSPIQLQLTEINHRYSLLGVKMSDRSQEINQVNDELKSYTEVIKTLKAFLETKEKQLTKESLPSSKEQAEKHLKMLKTIKDEMMEKQSEMDNFRTRAKEILHSKIDVKGASELQCQVTELDERWSKLWTSIKKQILFLQDLKDFQDAHILLNSWLSQREKMFQVLGPIASEPRMVSSQVQQVQVMKDEFSSQKSLVDRFNHCGTAIIQHLDSINANSKKVIEQMESIRNIWDDLMGRLEVRDKNLEAAGGVAKDFYRNLSQIQEKLQKINDSFDQLFESNSSIDEQLKKLIVLEEQLEKQRPLLTDIDSIGDQLCDILNDTASKNEIRNKIQGLEKTYTNLYKKINNKKAELESCLKEDQGFYQSCDDVQNWLNKTDSLFSAEMKFSANVDKLKKLAQEYELVYKAVMDKEHELHLLISKGSDMTGKFLAKQEQKNLKMKLDAIQKQWNKLKKTAIDRRTHLHCCLDNCQKYSEATEAFVPWLEMSEKKLSSLKPSSLQRTILSKQIKEMQSFKNDLSKHIQEFENLRKLGDIIISNCTSDKESILSQIDQLKKRWEHLNQDVSLKMQMFEDLSIKVIEYKEKLRDLQHAVQRLEDKLSSHDALGNVSRDPILLNRLKSLHKEATDLEKDLESVKEFSRIVINKAGNTIDASEILKDVESSESKLHVLIKTLEDRCSNLTTATKIISTFTTQVKFIHSELESLDDTFDKMSPVARDKKFLQQQLIEVKEFTTRLMKIREALKTAEKQCSTIISEAYVTEPKSFKEQLSSLQKQVTRFEEHIKLRETSVESIISRLERFHKNYSETRKELETIIKEEAAFQSVGGDVNSIRTQQQNFKIFRSEKIQPLCKLLEECNKMGQGVIQSAAPGVNTNELEQDLENLNESWNSLQERINEREKKLDVALLQSGKFQEALSGVQKWLKDTEEMVVNQKAPSADFKVVKAQVQEQKFLKKMLLDRQNSVMSLKVMGGELMQSSVKKKEQEQVDSQMSTIIERFEELRVSADGRMSLLEKTIPGAQELQNMLSPLSEWLEQTDKKLTVMSTIPVETELVKKKITEHQKLHQDIIHHKKQVEKLKEVSENLKKLIGKDEAQSLQQKVKTVTSKFLEITETSSAISKELTAAEKGIIVFTEKYEKTVSWIEKTTVHLSTFQIFSIYFDKLQDQVKSLKKMRDNIAKEQSSITCVLSSGEEIMKHASGEDTIQIKEKLDTLSIKFADLNNRVNDRLKLVEDSLPLVQSFYDANSKISTWLDSAEKSMKTLDTAGLNIQQTIIQQLQSKIQEFRAVLETLNHTGPRICHLSPGDGSTTIENMMSKANHRFEVLSESVQRKAERIELAVQRKFDVVGDIDELLDWFKEIEKQVHNADGLSPEPSSLTALLKEQKAVSDEVNSQKAHVRDILASAKKLMRESSSEDLSFIREKAESLKILSNDISSTCQDRLSIIEQALPLAEHFFETHSDLGQWLEVAEGEAELLEAPALNAIQIKKQQDRNKGLVQSVHEHKPLVDKLNKTGSALTKLCKDDETEKVEVILESDNSRYNALRLILREHQNALEEALQATSQFSDKLEGMLSALTSTADQIQNAEPISAHPERIQEQINDNKAVLQDLEKRTSALEAVKKAADDVIVKASSIDEPAVRDIKKKLDRLNGLWETIQIAARNRGKSLEEALVAAEKFWDELTAVMKALKELQNNLNNQEAPAVEPSAVQQQQEVLQDIKQEISQTKPEVDHCRQAGQDLMQLCGEPDKPEVKKHIEDLDSVWENVTTLYAKREQNLIDAMEKAMSFHDTLQSLLEFLDAAEHKFSNLGAVSADIDAVKKQITQLKEFKTEVDPHMVEIESLNRQAQELVERTSSDQSSAIREPLDDINKRWDDLLKGIVDRQQEMEKVLLKLGQFQHSLEELVIWMSKTEKVLNDLKPVFGDPQVIEVVLAKHKVLANDIQAHEASIEAIKRAGRQLIDRDDSEDAKSTQNKLNSLNAKWEQLQEKSSERQRELEEALKEALQFNQEIQDLLMWLSDIDGHLVTSKPVGGLPETAREQLNRFMDLYTELDGNHHKVENILQQGQSYLKRSGESSTKKLQHSLQTLRQRWENILNKANDRKIKLEIALREATEFHEALQSFVEWLTNAEKYLTGLKPVSRSMNTVLEQIEDHRNFQKDIGAHREVMLNLDKKGTHLKYFSQKQDVILIKNLLISVQHRWERIVSKAAERTRSLDHGYKEAKEFHDAWTSISTWLDEAEKTLDSITHIGNDPIKIKQLLTKHKEFQRILGSKQISFDATMRIGRSLKDRCPKQDISVLQEMMDELKSRWNRVCSKSVDRQRKLEEALLYSGQFKEAVQALMDWLDKSLSKLSENKLYHGDLDTVTSLIEQHKTFEEELKNRGQSLETIRKTAKDLKERATPEDAQRILTEVDKLEIKWKQVLEISESYRKKLDEALKQAESLHMKVHMLLEWLSDVEIKLRFVGPLPEDEETTKKQIATHQEFLKEMEEQELNKNTILENAHEILKKCHPDGLSVIRHYITIIQSRWEEISIWARQRDQRLKDHLRSLKDIMELLEELLTWLNNAEASLTALEAEPLPDDLPSLEQLIKEHQLFMDDMSKKQSDVEKVTKAFSAKREPGKVLTQASNKEKTSKDRALRVATPAQNKMSTPLKQHGDSDVKHPRARLLLDKWRTVWVLAMERQRRLQDKYNYLLELQRIKNFDFNEWRRRYLSWLNNKKSRIMDQFRKIDKNNDGKVTKQEFIDGILLSKFTTSRLEMERVADIFDINGDGFIDTKEYVDTLRPDRESGPQTDAEKIQDEVQRQVAKCTCVHRFKVYQVGEGKYRFGDSQKLRLVRILRSTVMVRVGGGWVALDEFLVKNDPCRAKGRTNLELREQFILAEGVSQSMTPFKPKPSPNSSVSSQSGASFSRSGNSIPSAGPITKIREKSERSTPMHQGRSPADTSSDISGPSFSETDSISNRSGLSRISPSSARLSPRTLGSKPSSRPSSRQGSRPSSRAPSDLSQDGVDDYKKGRKSQLSGQQNTSVAAKNSTSAIKNTAGTVGGSKIPSVKRIPPKISVPGNQEKGRKETKK